VALNCRRYLVTLVAIVSCLTGSPALAGKWYPYEAKAYGFRMLIPEMTTLIERQHPNGWGTLRAVYRATEIHVYVKLGAEASESEIEHFAWRVTRIPPENWKVVDKGKNAKGFKWFRTTKTYAGYKVAFGIYGVCPRDSYMLLLYTDIDTFEDNKAEFMKWYNSIKVF
jgi:hypothetical protein